MKIEIGGDINLEHCRSCGNEAELHSEPTPLIENQKEHFWAKCSNKNCHAFLPKASKTAKDAIERWNALVSA